MVRELSLTSKKVAIIGAGPAGCMCAYFLQNDFDVTLLDFAKPLRTLLPTGGGRCNLAYAEYDFKELAKNYPRGEKFLYSVFSRFSTADTIDFFENIGVKTYTQADNRIFPESNSSKDVRDKFLKSLNLVKFVNRNVEHIDFDLFDYVVVAIGGHSSYKFLKKIGHNIVEPCPALVGLKTEEKFPAGVSVSNVTSQGICGDLLFTHEGISGPLVYKLSSVNARKTFPYELKFKFCEDIDMQLLLNQNPHKSIKNLLASFLPKSIVPQILSPVEPNTECCKINKIQREEILSKLTDYKFTIIGTSKAGEVVTCGGVSLDEVDSRTMQSKIVKNLYFCGEVLDIDGYCGGFNLQNCWSTAFVAANAILSSEINQ